ncbi:ATP-grasp domain-containing protein [Aurantimonas sp. Leaf443]|uniref:ATP-grasp domain-containing protein n=1 Tax=Aurantimonas sp. Leaf443 TaxID=1736378 RepID=UPI0006FB2FD9|nr:ATP-grasp domain-containing protein [Aurantimonas sp. Leaf443]KQT85224.1 hypothetical protein ASG48_08145 [Aurantimonas sp. Leaf443]
MSAERPSLLCAAFSARQIAMSAKRAGLDALAVDFFHDLDLEGVAARGEALAGHYPDGFSDAELIEALGRLAKDRAPLGFVYGAGFEDRPALLERIAERWPILGNDGATVRALKDPERFAALCERAGVAHPEICREAPDDAAGWLSKRIGGAGGSHVRGAVAGEAEPERYVQRFVEGERWSAGFVAAGTRLLVLGFTRQWTAPTPEEPFRYAGAVGPLDPPGTLGAQMTGALERVVALQPLTGLCSADFVAGPQGLHLLEINPRAGATIDIFDTEAEPLIGLHLEACAGRLPQGFAGPAEIRATGLAWAGVPASLPAGFDWPPHASDRSRGPALFQAGEPLCTILASGATERDAAALFEARVADIRLRLERKAA